MAMASASAASGDFGSAFGSRILSITMIWFLSAWPAPTTVFLTWFGAYSETEIPNIAGASIATPRAWPSFSVATPSLLTKVCSTAASIGRKSPSTGATPWWVASRRLASGGLSSGSTEPQAIKVSRLPSISITPHPVRRRPGSIPRMRTGWRIGTEDMGIYTPVGSPRPSHLNRHPRESGEWRVPRTLRSTKWCAAEPGSMASGMWAPVQRSSVARCTASGTRDHLPAQSRHQRIRNLEIGEHVLDVVVFVQKVDQFQEPLGGLVIDRHGIMRFPGQRRFSGFAEFCLQRLGDLAEGFLRGVDLVAALAGDDVVGAGLDRGIQHRVVGAYACVIFDDAGAVEHEGHRAGLAEIAAGLGEVGADVGGGAVAVVGQRLDDHGHPAGTVALVADLVVILALAADRLFYRALDRVLRHVLLAGRDDRGAQPGIHGGGGRGPFWPHPD